METTRTKIEPISKYDNRSMLFTGARLTIIYKFLFLFLFFLCFLENKNNFMFHNCFYFQRIENHKNELSTIYRKKSINYKIYLLDFL